MPLHNESTTNNHQSPSDAVIAEGLCPSSKKPLQLNPQRTLQDNEAYQTSTPILDSDELIIKAHDRRIDRIKELSKIHDHEINEPASTIALKEYRTKKHVRFKTHTEYNAHNSCLSPASVSPLSTSSTISPHPHSYANHRMTHSDPIIINQSQASPTNHVTYESANADKIHPIVNPTVMTARQQLTLNKLQNTLIIFIHEHGNTSFCCNFFNSTTNDTRLARLCHGLLERNGCDETLNATLAMILFSKQKTLVNFLLHNSQYDSKDELITRLKEEYPIEKRALIEKASQTLTEKMLKKSSSKHVSEDPDVLLHEFINTFKKQNNIMSVIPLASL